eukprot:Em0012g917a
MAQENNESRSKSEKRRRVSLPWPVARKSEVVKVSYETKGEGKETADGAAVLVKPRSTSDEADISTRAPPIAPAPPNPDSVDFKMYWIPDKACKECSECGIRFSFVIRRHHCRVCGRIYCNDCCGYTVPSRHVNPGQRGTVKACLRCVEVSKVHRTSLKERSTRRKSQQPEASSNPFLDVRRGAFEESTTEHRVAPIDSKPHPEIDGIPECVAETGDDGLLTLYENEVEFNLQKIWNDLCQEMTPRTHRLRLRTYPRSLSAQEIVDWMMKSHTTTREEALQIAQALVDSGHLKFINSTTGTFGDDPNLLLEIGEVSTVEEGRTRTSDIAQDDPVWLQNTGRGSNIIGTPSLQTNIEDTEHESGMNFFESMHDNISASQASTLGQALTDSHIFREPIDRTTSEHIYDTIENLSLPATYDGTSRDKSLPSIQQLHDNHFDALLIQLVQSLGLSLNWIGVIKPLVIETCREVRTDLLTDDVMDIKRYVKVKKIPGGKKADSSFIYGVVCSKNVTHKKMQTTIEKPTIMLLMCAFEFQRDEDSLSVFDTLQLQEHEYLKNVIAKIKKFQPSIILVQKSVSRIALDMLHELGIVVAVNVKPVVMTKVARSTNATLLHSLDQLSFNVRLGTCGQFYVRSYNLPDGCKKTLMYFDQCDPAAGCVITLRGGELRELKKVKRVARFALHMAYNSFLESSFLADGFALSSDAELKSIEASTAGYHSIPNTPEWCLYPMDSMNKLPSELSAPAEDMIPNVEIQCPSPPMTDDLLGSSVAAVVPTSPQCIEAREGDTVVASISHSPPEGNPSSFSGSKTMPMQTFATALQKTIVTISPNIHFTEPYLLTESIMRADVDQYLPKNAYWSKVFKPAHGPSDDMVNACIYDVEETWPLPKNKPPVASHKEHYYKSMSEHAFTTSIFVAKASSNDMKAALADYRARAGKFGEDNAFFFLSAKRASEYKRCLKKAFKKYQYFERKAEKIGTHYTNANVAFEETSLMDVQPTVEGLPETKDVQVSGMEQLAYYGKEFKELKLDREDERMMGVGEEKDEDEELDKEEWNADSDEVQKKHVMDTEQLANEGVQKIKKEDNIGKEDKGKSVFAENQVPHDVKPKMPHKPGTDCMDPNFHQNIKVVYSTLCTVAQKNEDYCVRPHVIDMHYYGKGDLTLEEFLQRFCFRFHYLCNVCDEDMLNHCHRIVHNQCAIDVHLYSVTSKTRTISTWLKCTKCDKMTSLVEMNEKSLLLSFAKFLELKFYGNNRLLVKEVQPVEMSSFEEIAPKYFHYVTSAVNNKNPLLLAKILGMYTVGF